MRGRPRHGRPRSAAAHRCVCERGSWRGIRVLSLFHPSHISRSGEASRVAVTHDVAREPDQSHRVPRYLALLVSGPRPVFTRLVPCRTDYGLRERRPSGSRCPAVGATAVNNLVAPCRDRVESSHEPLCATDSRSDRPQTTRHECRNAIESIERSPPENQGEGSI